MLRRWWLWLLCGAVFGGSAGAVVASNSTPTYSAGVKLLVGPISADFDDSLRASGQLARTYAELATSRRVLDFAIARSAARTTATELQDSGAVQAQSNDITRIVSIEVEHESALTAARLANAIARRIGTLAERTPPQETASIERLLGEREISRLSGPDQTAVTRAVRRVLGTSSPTGRVQVVEPAEKPLEPVSPRTSLITLLAALMGMLAVGVVIVLRESSMRGVSDERSLGSLAAPPFLGALDAPVSRQGAAPLVVEAGSDATVEAYRGVATKIGFLDNRPRVRTLVIADAAAGRQGGIVAANLAAVLADTQRRVLLVDANELSGAATSAVRLDGRPGYGELTTSAREAAHVATLELSRIDQFPTLCVLPRGKTPVADRLDEEYVERLQLRFRVEADIIIVSCAPVHLSPGALLWGRVADGTLLIVEAGRTSHERVQETIDSLGFVGADVVGTVLARDRRLRGSSELQSFTMPASEPAVERPKEEIGQS